MITAKNELNELFNKRDSLTVKIMVLDKFFTMFLDKYSTKMDPQKTDTNIWKLYKAKLKEYDSVKHELTTTNYFISKHT